MATLTFPDAHRAVLAPYLPPHVNTSSAPLPSLGRPFVTLTYAQSLDSQISLAPGKPTPLSGPSSKAMTHFLRSTHDAILVGSGTAIADDPSLNCRLDDVVERTDGGAENTGEQIVAGQPRPVVLDRRARWDVSPLSKVMKLAAQGRGWWGPWVFVGRDAYDHMAQEKKDGVVIAGGDVLILDEDDSFEGVLRVLAAKGVRSVMVEGGATIINALLGKDRHLVDSVIVTVAPVLLGQGGVSVSPVRDDAGKTAVRLCDVTYLPLDQDIVVCGRIQRESEPL